MARRRRHAPALEVISWRDIPAQVRGIGVGTAASALLPRRFQIAIDRAARKAGMTDHGAYIGQWRRHTRPLRGDDGDVQGAVEELVAELDASHDRAVLAALVANGGLREEGSDQGISARAGGL